MKVCAGRPFRGMAGTRTRGRRPGLWGPRRLEDSVVSESAPAILCGSRARESRGTHTREDKKKEMRSPLRYNLYSAYAKLFMLTVAMATLYQCQMLQPAHCDQRTRRVHLLRTWVYGGLGQAVKSASPAMPPEPGSASSPHPTSTG